MAEETTIHVPGGEGRAFEAKAGQSVAVVNLEGKQVADFWAFNAKNFDEPLGTNHTVVHIGRLFPQVGDELLTDMRNPILEVTRDDCGRHDMMIAACDIRRYEIYYNVSGHRNCTDNALEALASRAVKRRQLAQPINLFQHMGYGDDGSLEFRESLAHPGDRIVFRALMDVVGCVSACPMDLNPISGGRITDLEILISGSA